MTVLDYSNWRPASPADLKAHGVVGVVRYIAPAAWGWPKALTPQELKDLTTAHVDVAVNWERNPADYLGGYQRGVVDGADAQTACKELSIGFDQPVYVSIDTGVPMQNFALATDYVRGFKHSCPHTLGLYGEGALIEHLVAQGLIKYGWQSESTAFPGNAAPTPHTVLRQVYGKQVPGLPGAYDWNDVIQDDWGQLYRHVEPVLKVPPQFDPIRHSDYVSQLYIDGHGAWLLQDDWGIITIGGPFVGTMHGNPAVTGRKPARIVPVGAIIAGANPPLADYPDWAIYECIATSGERYLPPKP